VLKLLKHLPRTNCRACGYLTCMAYAAALREGETTPQHCPPLWEDDYQPRREQLLDYLNGFGWRALDEW
jgi:CO dehydrogenase/acetyl-CoA synthase gamma subunit (corrinoid Fe-S protein)